MVQNWLAEALFVLAAGGNASFGVGLVLEGVAEVNEQSDLGLVGSLIVLVGIALGFASRRGSQT